LNAGVRRARDLVTLAPIRLSSRRIARTTSARLSCTGDPSRTHEGDVSWSRHARRRDLGNWRISISRNRNVTFGPADGSGAASAAYRAHQR
jgi:hypothetical protein